MLYVRGFLLGCIRLHAKSFISRLRESTREKREDASGMKEEKEGLLPGGIRAPYPFDAAETLDCGQAFRWVELPGEAGASL